MGKKDKLVDDGNEVKKKVIKRRKKSAYANADFLNKCQVPLSNRFEPLDEESNLVEMDEKEKKQKITPIVVTTPNINIQEIAKKANVQCDIKIISVGRKVFVHSNEDKTKLKAALDAQKIDYFSYQSANNAFKIILTGLPQIETSIIIEELNTKHSITPTKVTMFNTQAVSKLYLCEFDKSQVNNKTLNSIHGIYNYVIKWQTYKPKCKGPTQCMKCLMYGHGISSCN